MAKPKEVRKVRVAFNVEEATWRKLRDLAEVACAQLARGRASVDALLNRIVAEYLTKKGGK
jgi:hypothetical protein